MANINLISGRRAERVRLTKIARGMVGAVAASLLLGFLAVAFMTVQIMVVNRQIAAADSKLKTLEPIRRQIEADDRERQTLQPKLVTLTEARRRTGRWIDIMEGLKRAVPEETWLTNLTVENQGENGQMIRLNGTTVSQERVGETMIRLAQQAEHYEKVDLRYTQVTRGEYGELVEFELASRLQTVETAQPTGDANADKGK